jgi:uncharacterized protein
MKHLILLALLATNDGLVGDWQGALHVGPAELRLRLHVKPGMTATMDSVDQGAMGMPVDEIKLEGDTVRFTMKSISGSYEGKFDPAAKTIKGTWTQNGRGLPLDLSPYAASPAKTTIGDAAGDWQGTLDVKVQKLRLVLHVRADGSGSLDSVDQGANDIPCGDFAQEGRKFSFRCRAIGGAFEGELDETGQTINGKWSQGTPFPLVLTRMKAGEKVEPPKRTQIPAKPYPYDEQEVRFENKSAPGVTLAGTLTTPRGAGPFPVVITITGSGPQDRDESLLGHKPFLVIADYLTRHGIAVLRYDDRGTAQSTGNFGAGNSADFATDAEAAVDFVKTQPKIDVKRIGLLGHSEGGMIAPMVAVRRNDVAFLVLMAPTAIPGTRVLDGQGKAIAAAAGQPLSAESARLNGEVIQAAANGAADDQIREKIREALVAATGKPPDQAAIDTRMQVITSPWFRYFLTYDPATALAKVKCPVLALFGERDLQVLPADNLEPLKAALAKAGNTQVKIEVVPKANHLFQAATTGGVDEYARIEETIQPVVLAEIAGWINGLR